VILLSDLKDKWIRVFILGVLLAFVSIQLKN
jgi:hypothetical protein